MIENLKNKIVDVFGSDSVEILSDGLQPTLLVNKDIIKPLCLWLRDHQDFYFDFLSNITAVDHYPDNKFTVVYHLASIPFQTQLTLKVILTNDRDLNDLPELESVSSVWRTADWHEREAFDLRGVFCNSHAD